MPTPSHLLGHWIHSHEEDSDGITVYRPQSYAFPPARGRAALELRSGGQWTDHPIAAADGNDNVPGSTWKVTPEGQIELYQTGSAKPCRVMQVIAATTKKLTVRDM